MSHLRSSLSREWNTLRRGALMFLRDLFCPPRVEAGRDGHRVARGRGARFWTPLEAEEVDGGFRVRIGAEAMERYLSRYEGSDNGLPPRPSLEVVFARDRYECLGFQGYSNGEPCDPRTTDFGCVEMLALEPELVRFGAKAFGCSELMAALRADWRRQRRDNRAIDRKMRKNPRYHDRGAPA